MSTLERISGASFPRQPAQAKVQRQEESGMAGLWFEEFTVGQVFDHPLRRTVTETDNLLFSALTHNPASLHLDAEYMKTTEYGRILVNSCFTLGLMVGISVNDTTQGTAVANLGWDEVRFPAPIFVGDTLRIETEVLDLRPSQSRPGQGIVTFAHRAYNQDGTLVAHCKRASLQNKRA
jgi:acyl dehydratase